MSVLKISTPEAFTPLLTPARYKGAWGGRGSGKSHFFAELALEDALRWPGENGGEGIRFLSVREVQKSLDKSAKPLLEKKLEKFGLGEAQGFKVYKDAISTPGNGVFTFVGMKDHTADSVKSYEGYHRAWVEEAQSMSDHSLTLLRPTIRAEQSELWFSWNPQRPTDPVDALLRSDRTPTGSVVINANWRDNPWFPSVLEQERQDCLDQTPERYGHIWEGEYATVLDGAYFAKHLTQAQLDGRIGDVAYDDLLKVYAFWDIAGTSDRSDAVAIWIVQFSGQKVNVLDHYEVVGQPFASHIHWLQDHWPRAFQVLPHDGHKHDVVYAVTPAGALREAGFGVQVVPNQGRGAALQRIDATRRLFPRIWFNDKKTSGGREALGWYHEKKDENRMIGLGPNHDWSSHSADAFGLMAIWEAMQPDQDEWGKPLRRNLKVSP